MNYLASPPLVVAYALAGRMDVDLTTEPLGEGSDGEPVYLRDIWPTQREIHDTIESAVQSEMFTPQLRRRVRRRRALELARRAVGRHLHLAPSTYVKRPPFFEGMPVEPPPIESISGARVLALLGDSVTTDHISPAGAIRRDSPAGKYLIEQGVQPRDFNSLGSRRGNHEVMMRGTFANVRLRNHARARQGGLLDGPPPERRGDVDLRRGHALHGGGRAAGRAGRQGVRVRLLARLGRQGPAPARRAGGGRARATSASTARTSSAWASCRSSSPTVRASQPLGLDGRETYDVAEVADGRAHDDGDGPQGRRRRRCSSRSRCGSTRRRSGSTTGTAASSSSSCASCSTATALSTR